MVIQAQVAVEAAVGAGKIPIRLNTSDGVICAICIWSLSVYICYDMGVSYLVTLGCEVGKVGIRLRLRLVVRHRRLVY